MMPTAPPRVSSRQRGTSTAARWGVVASLLVAFALRAYRLDGQSLWSDEDITLDRAAAPIGELIESLPVEQAPLYFVAMHAWTTAAGASDFALRYPSLMAGVLAVALMAFLGRHLVGRALAHLGWRRAAGAAPWLCAWIMAVNPFMVWYGQEARMYALSTALALASLASAQRAVDIANRTARHVPAWSAWFICGVFTALTLYTHYYGAMVVAVLAAWAAIDLAGAGRRLAAGWLGAAVTAAALFAPWLPRAAGLLGYEGWRQPTPLDQVPLANLHAWVAGPTATVEQAVVAAWAYAVPAAAGMLLLGWIAAVGPRAARPSAAKLLSYALVPAVLAVGAAPLTPDYHPRYFASVVPALFLCMAAAIAALPRSTFRWSGAAIVGMVALGPLQHLYGAGAFQKQSYRDFTAAVEVAAGHEDTVLFLDGPVYGLTRRYEMDDSPVKISNLRSATPQERAAESLEARLAELAREYPHLWLAENGDADGTARPWLEANTYPVGHTDFQDITLWRYYAPYPDPNLSREGVAPNCPEHLPACVRVAAPAVAKAGSVLPILLHWQVRQNLPESVSVALRLVGPAGAGGAERTACPALAASVDRAPDSGEAPMADWPKQTPVPDRHGLYVPPQTPACTYRLDVVLYRATDLQELGAWQGPNVVVRGS